MLTKLLMLGVAPGSRDGIGELLEAYREHGLFSDWPIELVATRGAGPGQAARGAATFARALATHRRLMVHVHASAGASFWREATYATAAMALRCPVVLHLHGGGYEAFYEACGEARRLAVRALFAAAACVAVPCQQLLAWVRSISQHAHGVVLPTPVRIAPPANAVRPNLVLFFDRLAAAKGIFDLLEAVSQVRASVPDVRLVCAGEGQRQRIAVARHAEHLGIADAVKFTGWIGPSGKRALLESAAVCALPSYSEGMPVRLLEAMAAGVPVVATPVGGVPEVIADGVSGLLVAPGDVATLTRHLRRLLLDRTFGARLSAAGRETVRLRFAPERALARLERLYADLGLRTLRSPPPRPAAASP